MPLTQRETGAPYNFVNTLIKDNGEVLPGSAEIPSTPISIEELITQYIPHIASPTNNVDETDDNTER